MYHGNEWGLLKFTAFSTCFCFLPVSRMKCRLSYLPFSWGMLANICAVPCRDNFKVRLHACDILQSAFENHKRKFHSCSGYSHSAFFSSLPKQYLSCTVTEFSALKAGSFIIVSLLIKQWLGVSTCIKKKKKDKSKTTNQESTFNQPTICFDEL